MIGQLAQATVSFLEKFYFCHCITKAKKLISWFVVNTNLFIFQEYENQSSGEASFVKDLDRFDMILQAFEYEKSSKNTLNLQEFFDSTEGKFKHPLVTTLVSELNKKRSDFQSKT